MKKQRVKDWSKEMNKLDIGKTLKYKTGTVFERRYFGEVIRLEVLPDGIIISRSKGTK